jgi:hypothetical protein
LDSKAKGEKFELARKWMAHILEEADSSKWKIYCNYSAALPKSTGQMLGIPEIVRM